MGKKSKQPKSASESKASTALGIGCLTLFALPFAAVGAGMTAAVAYDLWCWRDARGWVRTPAQISAVDLDRNDGDDGDTFEATAHYHYDFNGRRYESDRVALHTGSDNLGSYQSDRADELKRIQQAGGHTVCFVDPDDPARAMLFRDLRPGLLAFKLVFAVVFGAVGFGLLGACIYAYRDEKRTQKRKAASPDAPWKWRDDWAAGRIRTSLSGTGIFAVCFASFWNLISWPAFLMVLVDANQRTAAPVLLLGAFPAIGTLLGAWAAYLALRRVKWGVSEFEMASVPGVLGGPLAGVIHAPRSIDAESGFHLRLACTESVEVYRGGETSTERKVRWEAEQSINRDLSDRDAGGAHIPVMFTVPYDLPPSGESVTWQLQLRAATPGIDYFAEFEVPVFKTENSAAALLADNLEQAPTALPHEPFESVIAAYLRPHPGGPARWSHHHLPSAAQSRRGRPSRRLHARLDRLVRRPLPQPRPRLFPWFFSLVLPLLYWGVFEALLGSTRLEYSRRGIVYSHRWLGLGRRHEIPRNIITAVAVEKSGTTYGSTVYRKVVARTAKRNHMLVSEIPRTPDAERLAVDIRRALELSTEESGDAAPILEAELPSDFR